MLTSDLSLIPGVTLPAPEEGEGDEDFLCFEVATVSTAAGTDGVQPVVYEIRAPRYQDQVLLGAAATRVNRRGGGPVPAHWRGAGLEATLANLLSINVARRETQAASQRKETRRRDVEERRQIASRLLAEAATALLGSPDYAPPNGGNGGNPSTSTDALPEFLQLCGLAYQRSLAARAS